jgi:hypothetical protein
MAEYELCPNDGTRLWYHSDQLGRVTGRCDTCGGRFRRSVIHVTPVAPVVPFKRNDDKILDKVRALVAANPGIAKQKACAEKGLNADRVRRALAALAAKGDIEEVRARLQAHHDKPTTVYYAADYDGPRAKHIASASELVYDVIAQAPAPISTDAVAEVVGMTPEHIGRLCRAMVRDKRLRQVVKLEPVGRTKRNRRVLFWALA